MSTQSIKHKDKALLYDRADDVVIHMAEKLILNRKYKLGKEPDIKDFTDISFLKRILCENNCRLKCEMEKVKEVLNLLIIKYK